MNVIGIDPGLSGGVAWIGYRVGTTTALAYKMPSTEKDLFDFIGELKSWGADKAYLELVRSSPQMGVVSAFTFGRGVGSLRMALIAHGIPFEEVTPSVWQGAMKCRTKGDKNVSKRRAQELFPTVKVTHAIADCLLIAEYGRQKEFKL